MSPIATELPVTHSDAVASRSMLASADTRSPRSLAQKVHTDCVTSGYGWEILGIAVVIVLLLCPAAHQCSSIVGGGVVGL